MTKSQFINPLFQRTEPQPPLIPPQDVDDEQASEHSPAEEPDVSAPAASTPVEAARPAASQAAPIRVATRRPVTATTPVAEPDEPPVKFTFYFSPSQLRQLDDLWVRAKVDHGQKVSKSEFVRVAVARLLEEFDKNPERVLKLLHRGRA